MDGGAPEISKSAPFYLMELSNFFTHYDSSNYSVYKNIKVVYEKIKYIYSLDIYS